MKRVIPNRKQLVGWYYIAYKVLSAIPLSIFSAFLVITLSYKAVINLIDFIVRYSSSLTRAMITKNSQDTIFCSLANVDDDNEIIYSRCDLEYVLKLFEKKEKTERIFTNLEFIEGDDARASPEFYKKEKLLIEKKSKYIEIELRKIKESKVIF